MAPVAALTAGSMPSTDPSKHQSASRRGTHQTGGSRSGGAGLRPLDGFVLLLLLAAPALAVYRLSAGLDYRWLLAGTMTISVVTYLIYAMDKRRAETGGWRVSESSLHLLELLGGGRARSWPSDVCVTNAANAHTRSPTG